MAKAIEDLTTEEQATFRSEIGVNTESVLELLEDATIEPTSIILPNDSAVVKPLNHFGGNGAGRAVVHDNETVGGKLLMIDEPLPSQHGLTQKNSYTTGEDEVFLEFGSIALPASKVVDGGSFLLALELQAFLTDLVNITNLAFNIVAPSQPVGQSIMFNVTTAPASLNNSYIFQICSEVSFTTFTTNLSLNSTPAFITTIPAISGELTGEKKEFDPDFTNDSLWLSGQPATLRLGLYVKTSDATLSGNIIAKAKWTYKL